MMKERPKWFQGVVAGGKSETVSSTSEEASLSESNPEPLKVEEKVTTPSDDAAPVAAMSFSVKKGGWEQIGGFQSDGSEISKESDLVRIYLDISGKRPANFEISIRPERVKEASKIVPAWTVDALHKYLSGPEVWNRPSFTKAVFEEIRERMLRGSMLPRE